MPIAHSLAESLALCTEFRMAVKMKPHKLDEAKIKKIVQGIQTGLPKCNIAASVGVNRKTLRDWLGDREDPHPFVRKLHREVAQAEKELSEERVDQVKQAARGGAPYGVTRITKTGKSRSSIRQVPPNWRAAAWLLECRYPKSFALHRIEVEDDAPDDDFRVIGVTDTGKTKELFAEYRDHPFNSKPQDLFAVHEAPVAARKAPYKLTEAKIKTIVQGVRKGLPWSVIAASVGVWFSGMILTEVTKRTLDAGLELSGENLKATLDGMEDWDTGGLIGVPVSFRKNSIPVGRIYRGNAATGRMDPVSDWIRLDD